MALIKISDLTADRSTAWLAPDSDLIELQPIEAAAVRGGWRSRRSRQMAADKLISSFTSQIASISNAANQSSNSFQITIPAASDGNSSTSININGVNIAHSGNFFYTDSDVSVSGADPIPGFPGAYTF